MLNGVTITSGPEFFQTLGMEFKETGRYYQSGEKKGQAIMCPDINSKDDIPKEIEKYFDCCIEFLKKTVGEENIVLAQVHYDEDTPHLQAYFMPIVNEVKRKSYEKDNNGNVMKEITLSKDGTEKLVPKLKRDDEGKIIYENVKGKFLNNDQFWKDLGGKESYAILQNKFNAHMKENGFRLDRGNVGTHKIHQTKLDYQINESKAELNNLNNYINNSKKELNELITNLKNYQNNNEINVKKTLNVYNKKDVDKLIDYAYNLKKLNKLQEHTIKDKTQKYKSLEFENDRYKNNREFILTKQDNKYKTDYIREQKADYKYLEYAFDKVSKALTTVLNLPVLPTIDEYIDLAKDIQASRRLYETDKRIQEQFHKFFSNDL